MFKRLIPLERGKKIRILSQNVSLAFEKMQAEEINVFYKLFIIGKIVF
jgi:hypothetical protein